MQKHFEDAKANYLISKDYKINVDIYIPSLKLAVEYDGSFYHKDAKKDNRRTLIINETGSHVIRIREPGLPALTHGDTIKLKSVSFKNVAKATEKLLKRISKKYGVFIALAPIDADIDLPEVYKLIEFSLAENSLQSVYPELAKEWDYEENGNLDPNRVTAHSTCSGKKVLAGFNDLLSQRPEIARQWDYEQNNLRPEEVAAYSHKKVWWKCTHGKTWEAAINARKTDGCKCNR